ncbi:2-hydroxyacid dehydrogenase [Gracilibacillus alcaliphilus]|uniref:2-hydroxyacid dehydrogenase n=1 Tax=Gracilibacillus alcaliphilus TaxID=1401441 RepID=UPI00195D942F|nr:D-glycerate dehydrogenase [Gracilibacillus alcaliphilus]MBM7677287.1 glyoxylate reductase [Gracilibacillus alcaliphilus]
MKPKIFITRKIPNNIVKKLEENCELAMWNSEDTPVPRHILQEKIREVDGLYCLLTDEIDEQMIESAQQLKVISNMAVGFNNIDITAAKANGIIVTNTPDVLTETTADLTFALLMATARRIPEAVDYIKNDQWRTWSPMQLTGRDIHGATLGIIGMGRIGTAVARRALGFNMNIIFHNRNKNLRSVEDLHAAYVSLETLLREADFVCVMVPYTKHTHHLIAERELKMMKRTSILINTSRGGVVDEHALYQVLKEHNIFGAGLDVFAQEPINASHPLVSLPNVVALPHIGSASVQTRHKMAELAAENLICVLEKRQPPYRIV